MKYWTTVFRRAALEAFLAMRWTDPLRIAQSLGPAICGGVLSWYLSGQRALGAIGAVSFLLIIWMAWFVYKVFAIPVVIDKDIRSKLVPLPNDESPLFDVKEVWWTQPQSTPPQREAYVIIEYNCDLINSQLRIWGYSNYCERHLIEAHQNINQLKGHRHRIALAAGTIFDTSIPPHWANGGPRLTHNSPHLALIELIFGDKRQEYRVVVTAMSTGNQMIFGVVAPNWNPYFWPEIDNI